MGMRFAGHPVVPRPPPVGWPTAIWNPGMEGVVNEDAAGGTTRRDFLVSVAGAAIAAGAAGDLQAGEIPVPPSLSGSGTRARRPDPWDVVVVGAGVFGAWTAFHLLRRGERVLLVDAAGPAHSRASSGGESRATRTIYGSDDIYTRMAWESLEDWRWLSARAGLPVFHPTGVLMLFPGTDPYVEGSLEAHRRMQLPLEVLEPADLARRYPQIAVEGVALGLYEPGLGALMARRSVQTLVRELVASGGEYLHAAVRPPDEAAAALGALTTTNGDTLEADRFVFACGPWLPKLFPSLLGPRIFPTRQEVFYFAPHPGDPRFGPDRLPTWADFNAGDVYYGFPDLESRGFKIAHDLHGPPIDPDTAERTASAEGLGEIRAYLARRFPDMAERPLVESRVCQYENSSNGDFLADFHPSWPNALLLGGGSGHGFKHGPALGRHAAALLAGGPSTVEPRFSLATKGEVQRREVH